MFDKLRNPRFFKYIAKQVSIRFAQAYQAVFTPLVGNFFGLTPPLGDSVDGWQGWPLGQPPPAWL